MGPIKMTKQTHFSVSHYHVGLYNDFFDFRSVAPCLRCTERDFVQHNLWAKER